MQPIARPNRTYASRWFNGAIISLALAAGLAHGETARSDELKLVDNAPDRYVVVKGDTLWGISGRFLQDPWKWPQIWKLNQDEIKNPHWIYPGDVIVLDFIDGQPRLRMLANPSTDRLREMQRLQPQIRVTQFDQQAAPTIPANAIEPFLSQPLVVDPATFNSAPRIAQGPDNRVVMTMGDQAFVTGLPANVAPGSVWQAFREGHPLKDPDSGEILGYEVTHTGDLVVEQSGEVSTLKVMKVAQEITIGDRLVLKQPRQLINYVPRAPQQEVRGKIISSYGGVNDMGPFTTVVINRGAKEGLELGHVLYAFKAPRLVTKADKKEPDRYTPPLRNGYVFVYKVYPRVAYALTLNNTQPVNLGDVVDKP